MAAQGGGQGMHNLTTLIKRLEAATSRLEDIASSAGSTTTISANLSDAAPAHGDATTADIPTSRSAPDLAPPATTRDVAPAPPPPSKPSLPLTVEAMDELISTDVAAFLATSAQIGGLVAEQASGVAKAFADQRRFLLTTTRAKRPDLQSPQTFTELLQDLQRDMGAVGDIRDANRASPLKEHLAMVGEGIGALQWLLMEGKPGDFVGEILGGSQMYGNRVLKAYKETDPDHVKYVQSYYGLLKALQAYIRKHYPVGVTWNTSGIDAAQAYREAVSSTQAPPATNGAPSAPPPPSGGPPPPPPPPLPKFDDIPGAPPPPPPPSGAAAATGGSGGIGAVFDQLNRGSAVTSGLKRVDKSQMTHKNPALRAGADDDSTANRSKSPSPGVKPKPESMRQNSTTSTLTPSKTATPPPSQQQQQQKPPKKELDGNKWVIANWDAPSQPLEVEVQLSQSLLITNCKRTTIILKGKANAISIDNCPRMQLLVDTLISSIDVIKSPNFAVQVTGSLPTIMLDQVDGASVYLGPNSLATEVFTSKCSSVNVVLPPSGEEEDGREEPLPEQIRSFIRGGKVVSEIVEHAG